MVMSAQTLSWKVYFSSTSPAELRQVAGGDEGEAMAEGSRGNAPLRWDVRAGVFLEDAY